MPAGGARSRRGYLARDRHLDGRTGVGSQMQSRVVEREPIGFLGDGLAAKQRNQYVKRFVHPIALLRNSNSQHGSVGWKSARTDAAHHAATGYMIELIDALRHH